MHARLSAHHSRTLTLLAFAAAVYSAALALIRTPAFAERPDLLSFAIALDITLVVPLAYWALVVRRRTASWRSLLPVVALSLLGARLVLPAEHRSFVGLVRYATLPLELALVGYAITSVRRATRAAGSPARAAEPDAAEALERGLVAALGDRLVVRVVAAEIATLYYALLARAPAGTDDARGRDASVVMTFAQRGACSRAITCGIGFVIVIEAVVLHLWLASTHPVLAWGLDAVSLYSLLWLVGHHRATGLRSIVLADGVLVLRSGLRLTARLPLTAITSVEAVTWRTAPRRAPGYLDTARPDGPNIVLTLEHPTAVTGPLGLRRTVARIGLRLEEPGRFVAAMRERCAVM